MENLEQLIEAYALNKNELDSYKKICDKENAEIKAIMTEFDLKKVASDNYVATISIQKRESMDEDALLEVLRKNGYLDVIRTKEYVDMDLLENAIYSGKVDKETLLEMQNCTEVKEVQTLRITKRTKEK